VTSMFSIAMALGCFAVTADDNTSNLEGNWQATSATRNGKPANDVVGHRLTFKTESFEIRSKGGSLLYAGKYTLKRDEWPAHIDFELAGQVNERTIWRGVYERKDKRLKICDNAPDTSKPRPESFEAPRDSGYILVVFERIDE